MDFEKLVQPIINYLNLSIKFWRGDPDTFHEYLGLFQISANALLLSLIGTGISLVIRHSRFGAIPSDPDNLKIDSPTLDTNTLLMGTFFGLSSPLLFELSFWLLGTRSLLTATTESVFNAFFLTFALMAPIAGILNRINYVCLELEKVGGWVSKSAKVANLSVAVICLWAMYQCFDALRIVLESTWKVLLPPTILSFSFLTIAAVPSGIFLWHWNKFLFSKKP